MSTFPDEVESDDFELYSESLRFCIEDHTLTSGEHVMYFVCSCGTLGTPINGRSWNQPRVRLYEMWQAHKVLDHTKPDKPKMEDTKPL